MLAKSNFELRRFRHDFNNIRIGLSKCLSDNDLENAMSILQSGSDVLYETTTAIIPYDTGNGIVDAILTDKQSKAKLKHITISFEGSIPSSALSPVDLCVIFGNTIDNAIEACEKIPADTEKVIFISSRCNSGFLFISICNPIAEAVTIKNNTIRTTKKDRSSHGYGLYSLQKTAKKYDGEIELSVSGNIFTVNIDLCVSATRL